MRGQCVKGELAMDENLTVSFSARHIVVPLVGVALCLTFMPKPTAAGSSALVEQLVARAVSVSGSERAGRVEIYIEQWSSESELARVREALRHADTVALTALLQQHRQRVGVVLMPGIQGHGARARTRTRHNVLFARAVDTPAGRQVIAIADEHLGVGEPPLESRKSVSEFNLIDIRFGPDGTGVGKVVSAADVAFSPATGLLEAKDYARHPARLLDVRVQKP